MIVFIYAVTGSKQTDLTTTNYTTSYGYVVAASRDEAVGKAMERFKEDTPGHSVMFYGILEAPALEVKVNEKA